MYKIIILALKKMWKKAFRSSIFSFNSQTSTCN